MNGSYCSFPWSFVKRRKLAPGRADPTFLQHVLQKQRSLAAVYLPGPEPSAALPNSIFPKLERWEDADNNEFKWQRPCEQ